MYFASTRTSGRGGEDIWVARRTSMNDRFGDPATVGELDTSNDEVPSFLSADGCRLYFGSTRPGGLGDSDMYVAAKPKR